MKFSEESLTAQSRRQLQALAKEHSIKANLPSAGIIELLLLLPSNNSPPSTEKFKIAAVSDGDIAAIEVASTMNLVEEGSITSSKQKIDIIGADTISEIVAIEVASTMNLVEEGSITSSKQKIDIIGADTIGESLFIGSNVEIFATDCWAKGIIKKINKKTYRVTLTDCGSELLVKHCDIRFHSSTVALEDAVETPSPDITEESIVVETTSVVQDVVETLSSNIIEEVNLHPAELPNVICFTADDFDSDERQQRNVTEGSLDVHESMSSSASNRRKSFCKPGFGELRRKSGATPVKSLSRPSYMPKATKTQLVRREASICRASALSRDSSSAHQSYSPSISNAVHSDGKSMGTPITTATKHVTSQPPCNSGPWPRVIPSPSPSTAKQLKRRKAVPDFQKMHRKMMDNLKPITDVVKRVRDSQII